MQIQMEPLALGLIDEGRFLVNASEVFDRLQREMCEYVRLHGDAAAKAKGELTLKVKLQVMDPETLYFSIEAGVQSKMPAPPTSVTAGQGGYRDEDGQPALFVRPLGSSGEPPAQQKFCSDDGRLAPEYEAGDPSADDEDDDEDTEPRNSLKIG